MEHRFENFDSEIIVIGKRYHVITKKAAKEIPRYWSIAKSSGYLQKLVDLSHLHPKSKLDGVLGVCGDVAHIQAENFDYFIGIWYNDEIPEEMETIKIAPSKWVVFSNAVEARRKLYTEWLPSSGYALMENIPCIECFYASKFKPRQELWVPIVKK